MLPFPNRFPTLLTTDAVMVGALAAAKAEAAAAFPASPVHTSVPISVAEAVKPSGGGAWAFRYAGFRDQEMFYSGSLLKVAAMLAAYKLRQSVNDQLAFTPIPVPQLILPTVGTGFNLVIKPAVDRLLRDATLTDTMRLPQYGAVFSPPTGPRVTFLPQLNATLDRAIVASDNGSAADLIKDLGYSLINGVLLQGGLFSGPPANNGIWLCGTYDGSYPAVRVNVVNDGPSAQATTCFAMTQLMALLLEGATLDTSPGNDPISREMLSLLAGAQKLNKSLLTVRGVPGLGPDFEVTHCKIGIGGLGPTSTGPEIGSEATVFRHKPSGRQFVTVFQNVLKSKTDTMAIGQIVKRTAELLMAAPAIPAGIPHFPLGFPF